MLSSLRRIFAITRKEVSHIGRDPFTMIMALGLPVIMVLIFGTAFEFNLDHMPLAVLDRDNTFASRQLTEAFSSSDHFNIRPVEKADMGLKALDSGEAIAFMVIDDGFEKLAGGLGAAHVQILVDGSDNTSAGSILSYLPEVQKKAQQKILGSTAPKGIQLKTRYHFNHELKTPWFIVPGLGVVIMAILSILLTSLTVAREWETGSMELLLSTPVKPIEIIIGKLTPYLFLGLGGVGFVFISARLFFGVPFRGSLLLYLLGCIIFLSTCMAQGLLISVVTRSQQVAMQVAMVSGLLPSIYLSGFIYPIEHMPSFFQKITAVLAPRWFIKISHNLYLKGSNLSELGQSFLALTLICFVIIGISAFKFKKDVEP